MSDLFSFYNKITPGRGGRLVPGSPQEILAHPCWDGSAKATRGLFYCHKPFAKREKVKFPFFLSFLKIF